MTTRRADIDAAKGFAILLVVFGHLVARADPQGVQWYEPLRNAIYAFHMPFFLYLSGLVAVYSGFLRRRRAELWQAARHRGKRLLLPFFLMGGLIVCGKLIMKQIMLVDNPPAGLISGLTGLFWHTAASPSLSIWYLFVLFVVSLGALALLDGKASRWPALLALCLLLYLLPLPAYVYADRIGTYAIFFTLGAGAGLLGARWDALMDRLWPLALAGLLACLILVAASGAAGEQKWILLPVGALSCPALHGFLRSMRQKSALGWFLFLGRYSFMIYLFNTICIGLAKGVLMPVYSWNGADFLPFASLLMGAGLFGPIALKRHALRRVPVLDRLTN